MTWTPEKRAALLLRQKLPALERVEILTSRIQKLVNGSGDYNPGNRQHAIDASEEALIKAEEELRRQIRMKKIFWVDA